jgi:hypothetical protein
LPHPASVTSTTEPRRDQRSRRDMPGECEQLR